MPFRGDRAANYGGMTVTECRQISPGRPTPPTSKHATEFCHSTSSIGSTRLKPREGCLKKSGRFLIRSAFDADDAPNR